MHNRKTKTAVRVCKASRSALLTKELDYTLGQNDLTTYRHILTSQLSAVSLLTDAFVCNGQCDGTHSNASPVCITLQKFLSCV